MKFVNVDFSASRDEVIGVLKDNERVNHNVRFDESRGKPFVKIAEKKDGRISVSCELLGGPSRDNGFIQGTRLRARLIEKDGITTLRGVILTEPIYHILLLALVAVFIVQCFRMSGFSVIPPILVIFDLFMFKNEFKKQGYIKRYILRASRRISKT